MREWPNRALSKTVVSARAPWVRIPLPQPQNLHGGSQSGSPKLEGAEAVKPVCEPLRHALPLIPAVGGLPRRSSPVEERRARVVEPDRDAGKERLTVYDRPHKEGSPGPFEDQGSHHTFLEGVDPLVTGARVSALPQSPPCCRWRTQRSQRCSTQERCRRCWHYLLLR